MPNPMLPGCAAWGLAWPRVQHELPTTCPSDPSNTRDPMARDAPCQKSRVMERGEGLPGPWLGTVSSLPDLCQHKTLCISRTSEVHVQDNAQNEISFPVLTFFQTPFHPHNLRG